VRIREGKLLKSAPFKGPAGGKEGSHNGTEGKAGELRIDGKRFCMELHFKVTPPAFEKEKDATKNVHLRRVME